MTAPRTWCDYKGVHILFKRKVELYEDSLYISKAHKSVTYNNVEWVYKVLVLAADLENILEQLEKGTKNATKIYVQQGNKLETK